MNRFTLTFGSVVMACMLASAAWTMTQVSPGTMVPVHYGLDGIPDRFASASFAVLVAPVAALLVTIVFVVMPRLSRHHDEPGIVGKAYWTAWASVIGILAFVHAIIVSSALGYETNVPGAVTAAVGIFLVVTGNMMGKIRSNRAFGIRTPWTLANESVWNRTHRMSGWLSVAVGFAMLISTIMLSDPAYLVGSLVAGIVVLAAGSAAYSYALWRREVRAAGS